MFHVRAHAEPEVITCCACQNLSTHSLTKERRKEQGESEESLSEKEGNHAQNLGTELSQIEVMIDVSSTNFEGQKMRKKFECGRCVQISSARKCTQSSNTEIRAHLSSARGREPKSSARNLHKYRSRQDFLQKRRIRYTQNTS